MHIHSYEQALMQYGEFRLHKSLRLYVPPILILVGTVGNVLSCLVMVRRRMRQFSTYFYLACLAVADIFVLYIGLLRLWISDLTGKDIRDTQDWVCKVISVAGYTVSDYSVWLIIALTCERYIVVCKPFSAPSLCNTDRAWKVVLALLLALLLVNLHFMWTVHIVVFKLESDEEEVEYFPRCTGGDGYEVLVQVVWPWVDAFLYSFLPFVVILVLNTLIIRQVFHAMRRRNEELQATSRRTALQLSQPNRRRGARHDSSRLTVMLLAVSFSFLLTTLPQNIALIASQFWVDNTDHHALAKLRLIQTITELLMYTNHSMNFFLYVAAGRKFRQMLLWIFCTRKKPSPTFHYSDNSQAHQSPGPVHANGNNINIAEHIRLTDKTDVKIGAV